MRGLPDLATLDLERDGPWLTAWLNEPERRNPLTSARVADLATLCATLSKHHEIRGLTIRGRGGVFCAGGDLRMLRATARGEADAAALADASRATGCLMRDLSALPQITVMAVEGVAMAGGCGLVCAGDVAVAEAGATLSFSETRLGLVPAQIAPVVVARLGPRVARRLLLTGARLDAQEARALGLVDEVVDGADALEAALGRARARTLACAPGAVARTKRLIDGLPGLDPDARIDAATDAFLDQMTSAEGAEGLDAFFAKRPPRWAADGD